MAPTLSILVPTYNRSALLKKALISILAQSFTDYEIIIVDNCSPDDTETIVAALGDSRVKYHKNALNIGPVNNHNRALRLATGRYICTFSDDDVMLPDNLAAKVAILEQYPQVGLVHSNIHIFNESDTIISKGHWAYQTKAGERLKGDALMSAKEAYDILDKEWNFISMPSAMVRKSVLDAHRIEFNNQLGYLYDWDLWAKISMHANFYYLSTPLTLYRVHSSNDSASFTDAIYFKEILLIKLSLVSAKDQSISLETKVAELMEVTNEQIAYCNSVFHASNAAPTPLWRKAWKYMPLKMQIKQMLGRA